METQHPVQVQEILDVRAGIYAVFQACACSPEVAASAALNVLLDISISVKEQGDTRVSDELRRSAAFLLAIADAEPNQARAVADMRADFNPSLTKQ